MVKKSVVREGWQSVLIVAVLCGFQKLEYLLKATRSIGARNDINFADEECYIISALSKLYTVFIRLSARGPYLIFGLSGWALI